MTARARFRPDGLWLDHDFRLFWQASAVSSFGTAVTRFALPLVATLTLDAPVLAIGLIAFAEEAPLLLFGLFAGVWVDRGRRLPIMKATDLLRAAVLLLVPFMWWRDGLSTPLLVAVALAVGSLTVFFEIAAQSFVGTLLKSEDYVEGNSKRYAGDSAGMTAGPTVGGALAQAVGPALIVLLDACSYLYSFACLRRLTFQEPAPRPSPDESALAAVRDGLREIVRNPYLRPITVAGGCITFVSGIGWAMLIPFASRDLALGPAAIGVALSASGLAAVVGSMLATKAVRRFGLGRALAIGLIADIPGMLLVASAGGGPRLSAALLVVGLVAAMLVSPIYDINQFSLRMAVTPDRLRGRVVATTRVVIRGSAALGALTGGFVADVAGLRMAVLAAALAPILPLIVISRSPVVALRTMPDPTSVAA